MTKNPLLDEIISQLKKQKFNDLNFMADMIGKPINLIDFLRVVVEEDGDEFTDKLSRDAREYLVILLNRFTIAQA